MAGCCGVRGRLVAMVVAVGVLAGAPGAYAGPMRMVGKGSATSLGGGTASYAYVVPCNAVAGSVPPFEIRVSGGRFNGQRFRLTSVKFTTCTDDPAVPSPAGGVDTQTGIGSLSGPGGQQLGIGWIFVDGGPGGANDFVYILVAVPPLLDDAAEFRAAPPGRFPGSDQATGFNTVVAG